MRRAATPLVASCPQVARDASRLLGPAPGGTFCRNGLHRLDPDNPWDGPDGRRCEKCHLARKSRYWHSLKGCNSNFRRTQKRRAERILDKEAILLNGGSWGGMPV
jgi:hypothetical protein